MSRRDRRDYRGVVRPVAAAVLGLAAALAACAGAGALVEAFVPTRREVPAGGVLPLVVSAGLTALVGLVLLAYGRRHGAGAFNRREAALTVVAIWLAAAVVGGLPFVLGARMGPAEAFFEAMSGLTTTGATVVTDIEARLPRPLLLWRSLLQWLGGMGIVVLFVAVFPTLGAGGKHMFRGEVPGTSTEALRPRIAETSYALWRLYAALTALEILALVLLGMEPFEAVCHAFATMSTGGFSTRDASVAAFDHAGIEVTIAVFMLLGSVNYSLYYAATQARSLRPLVRSTELRVFVLVVVAAVVVLAIAGLERRGGDVAQALRYAFFTTATFVSSTGFGTEDYMAYPPIGHLTLVFLMFMGGCAGSTAGGLKVERIVLMAKESKAEVARSVRPNVIRPVRMDRAVVRDDVLAGVMAFFVVFAASLAIGMVLVVMLDGVHVAKAFGAMLSCLSNIGPAPFYGDADHFAGYGAGAKTVFAFAMLLGRLEFFTALALLAPSFWRR